MFSLDLWRMARLYGFLRVGSAMSTGQDPTHAVTHILGFWPQDNRVMCLVHDGKNLPQNLTLREWCGTRRGSPLSQRNGTISWGPAKVIGRHVGSVPTLLHPPLVLTVRLRVDSAGCAVHSNHEGNVKN